MVMNEVGASVGRREVHSPALWRTVVLVVLAWPAYYLNESCELLQLRAQLGIGGGARPRLATCDGVRFSSSRRAGCCWQ